MRNPIATILTAAALLGSGPCGPIPGGRLEEGTVTETPADWRFLGASVACDVEVRPEEPHSVRANCDQRDGTLYVSSMWAPNKSWPEMVATDPRVRVRIEGRIYELVAVRVNDETQRARVLSGDPDDAPPESTWLWRLEPR